MSGFPNNIIKVIEESLPMYREHADDAAVQHGIEWADIVEIARTVEVCKKETDKNNEADYVYSGTGRDTHGRRMYMAGKILKYGREKTWAVITVHPADEE